MSAVRLDLEIEQKEIYGKSLLLGIVNVYQRSIICCQRSRNFVTLVPGSAKERSGGLRSTVTGEPLEFLGLSD